MRPRIKYHIVYVHRNEYPVSVMCKTFGVSRSGYYDFVRRLDRPDADAGLAQLIRARQKHCRQTYGYRRMWMWLGKQGLHYNPKTVLRVMKKYDLLGSVHISGIVI